MRGGWPRASHAQRLLSLLLLALPVCTVDAAVLGIAQQLGMDDFEDAVQLAAEQPFMGVWTTQASLHGFCPVAHAPPAPGAPPVSVVAPPDVASIPPLAVPPFPVAPPEAIAPPLAPPLAPPALDVAPPVDGAPPLSAAPPSPLVAFPESEGLPKGTGSYEVFGKSWPVAHAIDTNARHAANREMTLTRAQE